MRRAIVGLLVFAAACGGGGASDPIYKPERLKDLILQPQDAPVGMTYDAGASGPRELNRFTNDDSYQRRLKGAGFETSLFAFFHDDGPTIIADSFVILFATPEGAQRALDIIEAHIRADGQDLRDVPADGLGDISIGIAGNLQPGYPPGFEYVWARGNAVFGLVGAGPENRIRENAVRALAERMEARAD